MLAAATLRAQTAPNPAQNPDELVKEVVQNEVAADTGPGAKHMFTSFKKTPKGTQTHIYVETKEAMAGLLIEFNGYPLTPAQLQNEDGHLQWLENNPEQLQKKHLREKEDTERSLRIVKALPYAFHYQYAGTEKGTASLGSEGAELVKLKFTPNPSYQPPSRSEQVLTAMQGYLLIDVKARRLAQINAGLFKDADFGWGILGRLNKGGRFVVCQANVGENSWEITEMNLDITGKILFFKSITMVSDEKLSDFRHVPDLTFAEGVQLLKAEQEKIAGHRTGPQTAQANK